MTNLCIDCGTKLTRITRAPLQQQRRCVGCFKQFKVLMNASIQRKAGNVSQFVHPLSPRIRCRAGKTKANKERNQE